MWPKAKKKQLIEFYGNPDASGDGLPDPLWESKNLTYITPPFPMYWSWSQAPAKRIRVHKKCAESLLTALQDIASCHTPEAISYYGLDQCGGAYTFRTMRGANSLSMHAYGCAIDIAPQLNYLGKPWAPGGRMMPRSVVDIFGLHGWQWGGGWSRPDCMHFEATS